MPRGVFSDRVNWFMSAVKEGGRLRALAEARRRRRSIANLVIIVLECWCLSGHHSQVISPV